MDKLWYIYMCVCVCVCVLVTYLCPTLCNPIDSSPCGSSVHGILQARILVWDAIPFSKGYSLPRDQTLVPYITGRFFTIWATREAIYIPIKKYWTTDTHNNTDESKAILC